ncbi:MAG TPA: serine hydrolase [Nevskiaceae bacterium]|nr:serine hydrolase [Nevskiaceae bacterium]
MKRFGEQSRAVACAAAGLMMLACAGTAVAAGPAAKPAAAAQVVPVALETAKPTQRVSDFGLKSGAALVVDLDSGETLALKNPDQVMPIASLTKLMTALVVVEAAQPMDQVLEITNEDVDIWRHSSSRLRVGTRLTREQMLLLALMSSENRAAMALSDNYPGGRDAFIMKMNQKAQALGMSSSHFADPAGLSNNSVSTARDLHKLMTAAYAQPLIRSYTTRPEASVRMGRRMVSFINSNRMVRRSGDWNIELQKTGFTNEAGRCLVMEVRVLSRRLAMVFLDSVGTLTRYGDALRVRHHLELEAKASRKGGVASAAAAAS